MEKLLKNETSTGEMVTISRAEYEALLAKSAEQDQKIAWLMQQLRLDKKKLLGSSSEKTQEWVMEQLSLLFNEAEAYMPAEEPKTAVAAHIRRKHSGSVEEILPENVPVDVVEHRMPEEERICPACGTVMEEIGKEVRRTLMMIPVQVKIREDRYYTYVCRNCKETATQTPVVQTPKDKPVISGSFASPEAVAHLMTQKFFMGSPLYRQEQELSRSGVQLSRQTMSNWILRAANDWLGPVYDELHRQLCRRQVLHADETTLQVLREPEKTAQSKSYMWLYRTGSDAEHPIVLYEYRPDRKLKIRSGFWRAFRDICTRMATKAITHCRITLPWLAAGRTPGASLTRRSMRYRNPSKRILPQSLGSNTAASFLRLRKNWRLCCQRKDI